MAFYTIQILQSKFLNNYNAWGYTNILESVIDITDFEHKCSKNLPDFVEDLITLLPGLKKHKCDKNYEGRFVERLYSGTWIGHILEHVILELQSLADMSTKFGQTRETDKKGIYFVVFETPHEIIGREALTIAINLIINLFHYRKFDLNSAIERLKSCINQYEIGPSTSVWIDSARQQNIPYIQLNPPYNWFQFQYGKYSRSIWTSLTDKTSYISLSISQDKKLTKNLLERFGIPVAQGDICQNITEALLLLDTFKRIAIKPLNCNRSKGVSLDIQEKEKVNDAFNYAREYREDVIVERFYEGNSYCINVVGKKIVGIFKATEISIAGNGKSSISELIQMLNEDPRRGKGDKYLLPFIDSDEGLTILLKQQKYDLTTILKKKEKVILQKNIFNETVDIKSFHPNTLNQAILAAEIIKLDIAGIDLIIKEPSEILSQENGVILEINAGPGQFKNLLNPLKGPSSIDLGDNLLEHINLLNQKNDFIIGNVIGSEFDSYLFQSLKKTFSFQQRKFGFVSPDSIDFHDYNISNPELGFSKKCHLVLEHQELDSAVIHVNDFDLINEGLIAKNNFVIFLDSCFPTFKYHKYIQRPEYFLKIFRTPIDVLKPDGVAILNGDDSFIRELSQFSDGVTIFLSQLETTVHLNTYLKPNSKILHFYNQKIELIINGKKSCINDNIQIEQKNIMGYLANLALCIHFYWQSTTTSLNLSFLHPEEAN